MAEGYWREPEAERPIEPSPSPTASEGESPTLLGGTAPEAATDGEVTAATESEGMEYREFFFRALREHNEVRRTERAAEAMVEWLTLIQAIHDAVHYLLGKNWHQASYNEVARIERWVRLNVPIVELRPSDFYVDAALLRAALQKELRPAIDVDSSPARDEGAKKTDPTAAALGDTPPAEAATPGSTQITPPNPPAAPAATVGSRAERDDQGSTVAYTELKAAIERHGKAAEGMLIAHANGAFPGKHIPREWVRQAIAELWGRPGRIGRPPKAPR